MWRLQKGQEASWGGVGQASGDACAGQVPLNKVAIFGHSYVSHLDLRHPQVEAGLYIKKFGRRGAKVSNIRDDAIWGQLLHYVPQVTFLIIGGNDVNAGTDIAQLAKDIEELAREIEQRTGGYCFIFGLEKRTQPRGISAEDYNRARNGINRRLKRQLSFARTRYISMGVNEDDLGDGVHLTLEAGARVMQIIVEKARDHFKQSK